MKPTLPLDETTLVFAFRYALGRMSTAPFHMVSVLRAHWGQLETWTQAQIQREITEAISRGEAGRDCDVATWREVLSWALRDECPSCGRRAVMCVCSHDDDST